MLTAIIMSPMLTFVQVPAMDLINPDYLDVRATEVFAPDAVPTPGDPGVALGGNPMIGLWGQDPTEDAPGTTHFSIVDGARKCRLDDRHD